MTLKQLIKLEDKAKEVWVQAKEAYIVKSEMVVPAWSNLTKPVYGTQ